MISRMNAALFAKQAELKKDEKGFTLVELLVVVLIIGILAAIAIPFFLNQRTSAWEGQVTSDIKNAVTAAETYATGNNGSFADLTVDELEDNGYRNTDGVETDAADAVTVTGGGTGYTITFGHESLDDRTWTYNSSNGVTEENTTAP